jgi:phycocyanin alpha chain
MVRPASITPIVAVADSASRFPSSSELKSVLDYLRKAQIRLDAAEVLSRDADHLSQDAAQFVFDKFPDAAKVSKFLFTFSPEMEAHSFQEDVGILLRVLTYCLVIGDDNPLESKSLKGIFNEISRVIHESPEISPLWYINALEFFRNHHGLSGEGAVEINSYINYIVAAFNYTG